MKSSYLLAKKLGIIFTIVCAIVHCTGCMNRLDIQRLSIIMAMGIDITDEGRYRVSCQVLQTGAGKQQESRGLGQSSNGESGVLFYEGIGETVFDAMGNAGGKMSRRPFYGQLKLVVIGKRMAEKGISSIADFFGRFGEIRASLPVYVTKDEAASIISTTTPEDSIPVNAIDEMILSQIQSGRQPVIYLAQLIDTLASEDRYPILGVINLLRKPEDTGAGKFVMDGIAVFDGDKLINFLNAKEIEGYQYINGKIDTGSSLVELQDGTKISLEILETTSKIQTAVVQGEPKVSIYIWQTCAVREVPGKVDPIEYLEFLNELGKLQSDNIKGKVEKTLRIIRGEVGKDIIDIGGQIHRQNPKEWKQMKGNWEDIFSHLNIDIIAVTNVRGTGLLGKPPY